MAGIAEAISGLPCTSSTWPFRMRETWIANSTKNGSTRASQDGGGLTPLNLERQDQQQRRRNATICTTGPTTIHFFDSRPRALRDQTQRAWRPRKGQYYCKGALLRRKAKLFGIGAAIVLASASRVALADDRKSSQTVQQNPTPSWPSRATSAVLLFAAALSAHALQLVPRRSSSCWELVPLHPTSIGPA